MKLVETLDPLVFESDQSMTEIIREIQVRIRNYKFRWNPFYYLNHVDYNDFRFRTNEIFIIHNWFTCSIHIYLEDNPAGKATLRFVPVTGNRALRIIMTVAWTIFSVLLFYPRAADVQTRFTPVALFVWAGAALLIAVFVYLREKINRYFFMKYLKIIKYELGQPPMN